jgi:alpha-galactosidase
VSRKNRLGLGIVVGLLGVGGAVAEDAPQAGKSYMKEIAKAREWFDKAFGRIAAPERGLDSPYVVSFGRGDRTGMDLRHMTREFAEKKGAGFLSRTITFKDAETGLVVRIDAKAYDDFPAVEWVAHIKNTGNADTPLIKNIQALDARLTLPGDGPTTVHWTNGAIPTIEGFAPRETVLTEDKPGLDLRAGGGKSSRDVMPFFNLTRGDGGIIAAGGWTGEWSAGFTRQKDDSVACRLGQAFTHLKLHPGEEIRTPRIALVFYTGDRWDGQNVWRRFVLAHHRPTPNGNRNWVAPISSLNWGSTPAAIHMDNIEQIAKHDLPIDYYWIDAEWYGKGHWWGAVGNWEPKKDVYPAGFRPLADRLSETGRKLLLWFEPERVCEGTPWWTEHPEWLLRGTGGGEAVFNLGDPAARMFATDFISKRISDWKIGCFRVDFNGEPPLTFWNAADPPERNGMAEIRYVEGLYAFWDELLARHPGLIIDNCAGGGTRLDLETLHRGTAFWRSDGPHDPLTVQCYTWALLGWVPLIGTSQNQEGDDYEFRSSMSSTLALRWWGKADAPAGPIPADFPWDWAKRTLKQYRGIRRFYYGDYYPLTAYSQNDDVWMVYQLNLPESGECAVVALRRSESAYETAKFRLRGLDAAATYSVRDMDSGKSRTTTGGVIMETGLEITLPSRPGSAIVVLRKLK